MKLIIGAGLAGLLFALGLGLSGMTDPAKVIGFLDVAGAWDPSLAFVMGGGVGTYAIARRWIARRDAPLFGGSFPIFSHSRPDGRLVAGSALFGIGWGMGGWCPGPAFVSTGSGHTTVLLFVAAMLGGMGLYTLVSSPRERSASAVEPAGQQ